MLGILFAEYHMPLSKRPFLVSVIWWISETILSPTEPSYQVYSICVFLVPFPNGTLIDFTTLIPIFFPGCLGSWGRVLITAVALFLTVAFVHAIFCDGKYLKETSFACFKLSLVASSSIFSLLWVRLHSVSWGISIFRLSGSLQMVCCDTVSLVIDVSMFQI